MISVTSFSVRCLCGRTWAGLTYGWSVYVVTNQWGQCMYHELVRADRTAAR